MSLVKRFKDYFSKEEIPTKEMNSKVSMISKKILNLIF